MNAVSPLEVSSWHYVFGHCFVPTSISPALLSSTGRGRTAYCPHEPTLSSICWQPGCTVGIQNCTWNEVLHVAVLLGEEVWRLKYLLLGTERHSLVIWLWNVAIATLQSKVVWNVGYVMAILNQLHPVLQSFSLSWNWDTLNFIRAVDESLGFSIGNSYKQWIIWSILSPRKEWWCLFVFFFCLEYSLKEVFSQQQYCKPSSS